MKSIVRYGMLFLLLCYAMLSIGQGLKDTVVVKDVLVEKRKNKRDTALVHTSLSFDGLTNQGKRLSDIMSDDASIFLKNYGVGQLSSISINGSSAAQTEVLWNGIKINSPTTGQVDFSLFDLGSIDKASINERKGSAVGGSINLQNEGLYLYRFKSANTIRYGSFNTLNISTINNYQLKHFGGSTRVAYISADNDFTFKNDTKLGAPLQKQTNATTRQLSFLQQLHYSFNDSYKMGVNFWFTDAERQLPPAMTADVSAARQYDQAYRTVLYLNGSKKEFSFSIKAAHIYDRLRYTDAIAKIDSRSGVHAFRNSFDAGYKWREKLTFALQLHYDYETASSTGFAVDKNRSLYGVSFSTTYRYWHLSELGFTLKQELLDMQALPFAPRLFISVASLMPHHQLIGLYLDAARTYRIPSLNDLYWSEGGNVTLRPEKGWNGNLALKYNIHFQLQVELKGFCNYVTDWILWHPSNTGTALWHPDNVSRVLSRGLNASIFAQNKESTVDRGFYIGTHISYSFTKTTSLDAVSANDNSAGKQLIYVPLHNFSSSIQVQYRNFYIRSIHSYTSERFTTTDNSQSLDGFYLTHLEIGKDFYWTGKQLGLSFRINNLTNTQYQVVEQRPMAGRSYEATLRLNLTR